MRENHDCRSFCRPSGRNTLLALVAVQTPTATAGVKPGTVKCFNGGLHRPGGAGRPTPPRIVVRNAGSGWRAATVRATFRLDLYEEAGRFSDIHTVWATVRGAPRYLTALFTKPSGRKARKVRITGGRFIAHANGMGPVSRTAENVCAAQGPANPGDTHFRARGCSGHPCFVIPARGSGLSLLSEG